MFGLTYSNASLTHQSTVAAIFYLHKFNLVFCHWVSTSCDTLTYLCSHFEANQASQGFVVTFIFSPPLRSSTCCEKHQKLLSSQLRWNCASQMSIHQMAAVVVGVTRNFQSGLLLTQFAPSFTDDYFRPAPLNGNHI